MLCAWQPLSRTEGRFKGQEIDFFLGWGRLSMRGLGEESLREAVSVRFTSPSAPHSCVRLNKLLVQQMRVPDYRGEQFILEVPGGGETWK